jgi:hypothetical protein
MGSSPVSQRTLKTDVDNQMWCCNGWPMTHGGKRHGSGRKRTGRRPYLLRMTPEARRGLNRSAEEAGRTVPEHLDAVFGKQDPK